MDRNGVIASLVVLVVGAAWLVVVVRGRRQRTKREFIQEVLLASTGFIVGFVALVLFSGALKHWLGD